MKRAAGRLVVRFAATGTVARKASFQMAGTAGCVRTGRVCCDFEDFEEVPAAIDELVAAGVPEGGAMFGLPWSARRTNFSREYVT